MSAVISFPFPALVAQERMQLALLLAAVDWRLGVILRGDKGAGKTTAARALAALLPGRASFLNLPLGATEDRLIGGIDVQRALRGEPALRPGILSEANGGVLYVDEVNLLPGHLADALLDACATGLNVIEREGFSETHVTQFVLLGSMNAEEGALRPQLLDRFALSVDVEAPLDAALRQQAVERRLAFDMDPASFRQAWSAEEAETRRRIERARACTAGIACSPEILKFISTLVCDYGVRSLRADLAIVRASRAYAALEGADAVVEEHVMHVAALALNHRTGRTQPPSSPPPPPKETPPETPKTQEREDSVAQSYVFPIAAMNAPTLNLPLRKGTGRGANALRESHHPGPVTGSRASDAPCELDVRATLTHSVLRSGEPRIAAEDLHEKLRTPVGGKRLVFAIDSSGSHAAQARMRKVKGVCVALMERMLRRNDEVAVIVFRGSSAEVLLEPTKQWEEARAAMEYLPTGGRTPLAHGLSLAAGYAGDSALLVVVTDGRANVPLHTDNAWADALETARTVRSPVMLIDTSTSAVDAERIRELGTALRAERVPLEEAALSRPAGAQH